MTDHSVIWLQPWCEGCVQHCYESGRQWCQDDVWTVCEECGRPPTKYVIAPEVDRLRAALSEVHRRTALLLYQNTGLWSCNVRHDKRTIDVLNVNQDIAVEALRREDKQAGEK